MKKGIFIVIEGSDGSGKGTHFNLLTEWLEEQGREIATYDFPQYDQPSSYFVREYLNGKYGGADELGAYKPSFFYALDRFDVSAALRKDLAEGKLVICNRFTGSSMAHQGQKLKGKERTAYFDWLFALEFDTLSIPKPDLNIVLIMPADIAQKLVDQKGERNYINKKRDIHEADINHLRGAVAAYQELCQRFPDTFTSINCTENNQLRAIDEIQAAIRHCVNEKLLSLKNK
jgi:dTMP kinase